MKINVYWDFDVELVESMVETTPKELLADTFDGITINMSDGEIIDNICAYLHSIGDTPEDVCQLFDVPYTVDVPDSIPTEEIADYLSDEYGYFVNSFTYAIVDTVDEVGCQYAECDMMLPDSEVEIDIDIDGNRILVCDYSEARGSAEVVKVFDVSNIDLVIDDIQELCNTRGWFYAER